MQPGYSEKNMDERLNITQIMSIDNKQVKNITEKMCLWVKNPGYIITELWIRATMGCNTLDKI